MALPGLAVFAYLGMPGSRERRLVRIAAAAAVYVVVALVVADRDAAVPGARPPVRDRLDQRQRVERGVRVQRHRPARRQITEPAPPSMKRAIATRSPPSPSATTSRSSRRPPRACSRASGRCPASASDSSCWSRCCSGYRRWPGGYGAAACERDAIRQASPKSPATTSTCACAVRPRPGSGCGCSPESCCSAT